MAVGAFLARARMDRVMHPVGQAFDAEASLGGVALPATVRFSKGVGTRPGRADVLGFALRVHAPDGPLDLLWSTAGRGRFTRHVPWPRRDYATVYGSVMPYRLGGRKVYLWAEPGAAGEMVLTAEDRDGRRPLGRVTVGAPTTDADLAFDPVRNTRPGLHPVGLLHRSRKYAYRASQWWRLTGRLSGRSGSPPTRPASRSGPAAGPYPAPSPAAPSAGSPAG